jgi:hypothetical protein
MLELSCCCYLCCSCLGCCWCCCCTWRPAAAAAVWQVWGEAQCCPAVLPVPQTRQLLQHHNACIAEKARRLNTLDKYRHMYMFAFDVHSSTVSNSPRSTSVCSARTMLEAHGSTLCRNFTFVPCCVADTSSTLSKPISHHAAPASAAPSAHCHPPSRSPRPPQHAGLTIPTPLSHCLNTS